MAKQEDQQIDLPELRDMLTVIYSQFEAYDAALSNIKDAGQALNF